MSRKSAISRRLLGVALMLALTAVLSPAASAATGDDAYLGLSEDEYRKLNQFFDVFINPYNLEEMRTEAVVLAFGCLMSPYQDFMGDRKAEKDVEATLSRYFRIEKVYHGVVDISDYSYRDGFYYTKGGLGGSWSWYNVSSYTDNGDGTFTALVNRYASMPESFPEGDSQYEPMYKWQLPPGAKIIDGRSGSSLDISRLSTNTVIIKPYVYNGAQTWQIASINGWDIPKVLFASAAPAAKPADSAPALIARPTVSPVLVNGQNIAFEAYNIDGANYFKLRDLAYALNGTAKQFTVGWDGAANAISLTSGSPYTSAGDGTTGAGGGNRSANPTSSKIYLDGGEISLTAYNIDNNNYFKLRDIGAALDVGVAWDASSSAIVIDTGKGYDSN
jgi:hypothetical protein